MNNDWLNIQAKNNSEKIFLKYKDQEFSFEEVNNIVYDKTLALIDFGIIKKKKVALYISNPIDFIECYLACYKLGLISIIINYHWKIDEIKKSLNIVKPDYVICSWADKNLFIQESVTILFFEELSKSHGNCYPSDIPNQLNDIQSILFTSGTEGMPKPVCLSYDNFFQSTQKWQKKLKLNKKDEYMLCLPLYHIGGLAIIMRALHIGFSINIIDNLSSHHSIGKNITITSLVPTMLQKMIDENMFINELKNCRCIILSGSKISNSLLSAAEVLNLNIFIAYGMTESCSSICGFWPLKEKSFIGSVGKAFDGVNINIKNDKVIIESNTIMQSYYKGNKNNGIFESQDIGEIIDGYLYIKGRNDNIIISGGENIDQSEILNAINSIDDFDDVSIYKKNDSYWGEISGVKIITDKKIDNQYIKDRLSSIISKSKIPKEIIILSSDNKLS